MMNLFNLPWKTKQKKYVTIVSGLPRSGTSMMMKMLEAGGLGPLTDEIRVPDQDNPRGYYEFERVKKLPEGDVSWVEEAQGKVVKIISALLEFLPKEHSYKIIFMRREMKEILASQQKMLERNNKSTDTVTQATIAEQYTKHLARIDAWLKAQPNMEVLTISYNEMIVDPQPNIKKINQFLDNQLDMKQMNKTIDSKLYRQRK